MSKLFLPIVLIFTFPLAGVSQATQLSCTAGVIGYAAQSPSVTRSAVGASYSLTASVKSEITLSDGNIISASTTSRQIRDGQGRIRIDEPSFCAVDKDGQTHWEGSSTVTDPVAKTHTTWQKNTSSSAKTASLTHVPFVQASIPPTAQMELDSAQQESQASQHAGNNGQQITVKDLGKRNIAGLDASGMRITRIVPAGQRGNSLPLNYVEEKWVSNKYGIILLDIKDDPILGKTTYEVKSFITGEPDPSSFQLPSDYKISERTVN